ncbi:hypothetical protein [Microvirga sp. P5_D2]
MILNALVEQVKRRSKDDIKDETAETHWMHPSRRDYQSPVRGIRRSASEHPKMTLWTARTKQHILEEPLWSVHEAVSGSSFHLLFVTLCPGVTSSSQQAL